MEREHTASKKRPQLPDSLQEPRCHRTEQPGVHMLPKAIPDVERQPLVTDRALSSTAILVRFQPGGAGEKQLLSKQLTDIPSSKNVPDLAASIRSWCRHFGRAQDVKAVLPDGVLLVKALDRPVQQLAVMDQQAAFRLSQSRMQLQLDEKPEHSTLWAFSQCVLAEAETLRLMATSATTPPQTPLKLKQLQTDQNTPSSTTPLEKKTKREPPLTNPANTGHQTLGVGLVRLANGSMHGKECLTKLLDVGTVAAKNIENKTAQ